MSGMEREEIQVTSGNLWLLERYLNVFDSAALFPADAFSSDEGRGVPVVLHTDRGFDIETDIECSKMQLRNRSKLRGCVRWTSEHGLRVGDVIVMEKTGEREYSLRLVRRDPPSSPLLM